MLELHDIAAVKTAQWTAPRPFTGVSAFMDAVSPTLEDLYTRIRSDPSLSPQQALMTVTQIQGATGMASPQTPISQLIARGLGGILGYLISKYFGAGVMGQLLSAVAGAAVGNEMAKPPDPWRGYRLLG